MGNETSKTIDDHKRWMNRVGGYTRDMTMLDHFAAQALPQMLQLYSKDATEGWEEEAVERAYLVAEMMVAVKDCIDD
jgi:hypothetical protein